MYILQKYAIWYKIGAWTIWIFFILSWVPIFPYSGTERNVKEQYIYITLYQILFSAKCTFYIYVRIICLNCFNKKMFSINLTISAYTIRSSLKKIDIKYISKSKFSKKHCNLKHLYLLTRLFWNVVQVIVKTTLHVRYTSNTYNIFNTILYHTLGLLESFPNRENPLIYNTLCMRSYIIGISSAKE